MSEKRWQVDVRGGCVGIYYAGALIPDCASHWPEPCLRIDGQRVMDVGGFAGWVLPEGTVMFAAGIALALDRAGIRPPEPAAGEVGK